MSKKPVSVNKSRYGQDAFSIYFLQIKPDN
jgi:hypothetical protein